MESKECKHISQDYDHTHDIMFCCDCQESFPPTKQPKTQAHTEGWEVKYEDTEVGRTATVYTRGSYYEHIATFSKAEQADKAVKAVNSHQELVEALRELVATSKTIKSIYGDEEDFRRLSYSISGAEKTLKNTEED